MCFCMKEKEDSKTFKDKSTEDKSTSVPDFSSLDLSAIDEDFLGGVEKDDDEWHFPDSELSNANSLA